MVKFEGQERRMDKINACLKEYGIADLEAARELCLFEVGRIEANPGIHPGYLYLAFSHPIVQAQLSAVACGSVVDAVYPEDVEKFILPPQIGFEYDRVTTAWEMISKADSLKTEACQLLLQQMNQ